MPTSEATPSAPFGPRPTARTWARAAGSPRASGSSSPTCSADQNVRESKRYAETVDASRPLPFGDGSFDAVISNDAMCHMADRPAVLREWYRVLKPGGRALFTDAMVVTGVGESIASAQSRIERSPRTARNDPLL